MHSCDVLIVGGGPAGSTLAWSLRHSGLSITILDKATFPRDKVCAGWVTPEVMAQLRIDIEAYRKERTLQPIDGFRVGVLGGPLVETHPGNGPASYGIRRFEFDHFLLQRSGARLLLGTEFRSMEREGQGWLVNGNVRARLIVGAGGHFCPVARALRAKASRSERVVAAQEIEFLLSPEQAAQCAVSPDVPELFFTPDLQGYGWAFRKGRYLNIGLGREDNKVMSSHMLDFRDYLVASGRVPRDAPRKFKGHAYLLYPHARRSLVEEGVLLIGDSAGLAFPESGEGIRPAVESGRLAAQVIAAAQGDFSRKRLETYAELLTRRFGRRRPEPGLLERLPMALKRAPGGRLLRTGWFVRNVVVHRWFLRRHLPPLACG